MESGGLVPLPSQVYVDGIFPLLENAGLVSWNDGMVGTSVGGVVDVCC